MAEEQASQEKRTLKLTHPMMQGDDIETLQHRLKALGYTITDLDGIFGNELDRAVKAFQETDGLQPDGVVGTNTYEALDQAESGGPVPARPQPTTEPTPTVQPEPEPARPEPPPTAPVPTAIGTQPVRDALLAAFTYAGLNLAQGTDQTAAARDLQRHLRATGYLRSGIDGAFGGGTANAIRALQHDLLNNDGSDAHGGEAAPVRMIDYNKDRVSGVTGIADENTVACIRDILNDPNYTLLPYSDNPAQANTQIRERVAGMITDKVPVPFLVAILQQESNFRHFNMPRSNDEDAYIVVGCDTNDKDVPYRITSRGYGAGQYTLFHHPPRQEEVEQFMLEIAGNVERGVDELREKFDGYITGNTSGTTADDRIAEAGNIPLRLCKYEPDDERHLKDCVACMKNAGTLTIEAGVTSYYKGTSGVFQSTQYHKQTRMENVPVRAEVGCDWPYGVRRYNGSGVNSYWYQAEILVKIRGQETG